LGTKLGKWKLDAGINQQHYHYDFTIHNYNEDLSDTTAYIMADFYNILPSATIMFTIDSLQDLKLSYSRTARAPWYSQLNPILFKRNPYSWSQGNPDLTPIVHNNVYLGYSLNKPMWNLSADLFYTQTNNDVAYLQIPISESIHLSSPENYAYNSRLGIDLGGYLSINGKYNFNLSGSFYHSEIDSGNLSDALENLGITPENVKQKNFGYNIKLSTDVSFSKNTSAMFYVNYTSREYSLSGYEFDQISSSINMTQRFFDRRLTLSVGINNLLNDLMPRGSYYDYMNQTYTEDILYSTQIQRMLFVSLKYRFNKGDRNTGQVGQDVN
jgi:outer membrane receptor protein involved in Fe transport